MKGDIFKSIRGSVRGKIGCSCYDWGHKSPTRLFIGFLTDFVIDVAPLDGRFTAIFKNRYVGPIDVNNL